MSYLETVQKVMKSDLASSSIAERDKAARDVIGICSFACAGLALQPIPGLEQAILPIQAGMIVALAHIYGQEVSKKRGSEIVLDLAAITGANVVSRAVLLTVAKVIFPVVGGLVGAPYVFSVTWATGYAAIHYLRSGGRPDKEEIRKIFEEEKAKSKAEYSEEKAKASRPTEKEIHVD
ncbi:MAG: DUF697 domain-containing protein [Candidatus Wallbacteria bacterium]|nr:DUF697 domain-containing protein [Candidatus Wallbacteria bacterium]